MLINGAFDSRTLAKMNAALDGVCMVAARGEEYSVRKLIARQIIRCARGGKTTLDELTIAGERALVKIAAAKKK
jgi:predicted MarR family transcription regulator